MNELVKRFIIGAAGVVITWIVLQLIQAGWRVGKKHGMKCCQRKKYELEAWQAGDLKTRQDMANDCLFFSLLCIFFTMVVFTATNGMLTLTPKSYLSPFFIGCGAASFIAGINQIGKYIKYRLQDNREQDEKKE